MAGGIKGRVQTILAVPQKPINMEAEDDLGFTQTPGELDGGELAAILRRVRGVHPLL